MSTAAERKFINLRKRLDQLGYKQPLGIESLPLVEKLFRYLGAEDRIVISLAYVCRAAEAVHRNA